MIFQTKIIIGYVKMLNVQYKTQTYNPGHIWLFSLFSLFCFKNVYVVDDYIRQYLSLQEKKWDFVPQKEWNLTL